MSLADINEDSTSWGNFRESKFNFTGKYSIDYEDDYTEATTSTEKPDNSAYILGTGVTDYTKKNNIYDLAGNCLEWTTESDSSSGRVYRGGDYYNDGFDDPACGSGRLSAGYSYHDVSFRSALYVSL